MIVSLLRRLGPSRERPEHAVVALPVACFTACPVRPDAQEEVRR